MIKGKTSTGFSFVLDEEVKDDYDLFNAFTRVQEGDMRALDEAITLLLGDKQRDGLRAHCKGKSGRILASKMVKEVEEIISILGKSDTEIKN